METKNLKFNIELVKFFNAVTYIPGATQLEDVTTTNNLLMPYGVIADKDACINALVNYISANAVNYNATFYRKWNDVLSKSRFELYVDQVLHYMTTYGTNFALGNGFVPAELDPAEVPAITEFKVIKYITPEEMYNRCMGMLSSGVALMQSTMTLVADFICDNIEYFGKPDMSLVKNKEAIIYICDKLHILPSEPVEMLRYIVFKTIGKTCLIKDKATIRAIQSAVAYNTNYFCDISTEDMKKLASIFYRFKPIFLAFKATSSSKYSKAAHNINVIRRMAVKEHKPMTPGFWQTVLTEKPVVTMEQINELNNYKKIALMQACLQRHNITPDQIYTIRNRKIYIREGYKPSVDMAYCMDLYTKLYTSLCESMRTHSTKEVVTVDENGENVTTVVPKVVKIHSRMHIALPSSEKTFVGNYPFGTTYDLHNDNFIGIYWRNAWGTRDFDLSLLDNNFCKIGWNAGYYNANQSIVYSGDMTNADPDASEVLWLRKINKDFKGLISVNQYNGNANSTYKLYFGDAKWSTAQFNRNFMVDPNDIIFEGDMNSGENSGTEQILGFVHDNQITIIGLTSKEARVSSASKMTSKYFDLLAAKCNNFVDASTVLASAGYTVVDETYTGEVDHDFTQMDKDSVLSMLE